MRIRNARQSKTAADNASVLKHEVDVCGHGGHTYTSYLGGPGGENRLLEVPFANTQCEAVRGGIRRCSWLQARSERMRPRWTCVCDLSWSFGVISFFRGPVLQIHNARQSEAAPRSAGVFKHELDVCGHGGQAYASYLGGSGGEYRHLEVPFGEIRNSRRPAAASDVGRVSKHEVGIHDHGGNIYTTLLGEPKVNIAYSISHFANTQCEAVRARIRRCCCSQTRSVHIRSWWTCLS